MRIELLIATLLLLATAGFSATIHVPDNYATIQGAIDASGNGDTIIVRPGTFMENIDFVGKAITLKSERGPAVTVIDGKRSGSVVTFGSGEGVDSVLDGFFLTNGTGTSGWVLDCGGGIFCDSSSPTITGNIIASNDTDVGGGIFCRDSSATIASNIIRGNRAGPSGGGIHCDDFFPAIRDNIITGNQAYSGGGLYDHRSSATITGNWFSGNTATEGGGIYCDGASSTIANNTISANRAGEYGGGIFCMYARKVLIINNTIAGNASTSGNGGGIGCEESSPTIANAILWDNSAPSGPEIWIGTGSWCGASVVTISYCDVDGGQASCYIESGCTLNWGGGMIDADPLFADSTGDDFHLTWKSPCREAGDSAAVTLLHDFEGDPRIAGAVDLGADEFYYHLYSMGNMVPGMQIDLKVVGVPNLPALLAFGTGIQNPPQITPHGNLWLKLPFAISCQLGPVPGTGILVQTASVPAGWVSGSTYPIQALVGVWGGWATRLTNMHVLKVE